MFTNMLIILPSMREALGTGPAMGKLMASIMKRFRKIVYYSIGTLVVTGFASVFLPRTLSAPYWVWISVIGTKHIFVIALVILAIYSFQVLAPKIAKLSAEGPQADLQKLQKRQLTLAKIGLVLGLVILLFSASASAL